MSRIKVSASNYPYPYSRLNHVHDWQVSKIRLVHSVLTVGIPSFTISMGDTSAVQHALGKSLLVSSAVDWTMANLQAPMSYRLLEQSEKTNISYWLGMGFAKIAAHRLLRVSDLQHTGPLLSAGHLKLASSKSKVLADLVGRDRSGNWHVFEAKGRSKIPRSAELTNWKRQAQSISHVNGVAVATNSRSLVVTGGKYQMLVLDPPAGTIEPSEVIIDTQGMEDLRSRAIRRVMQLLPPNEFMSGAVRGVGLGFDSTTRSMVYVGLSDERREAYEIGNGTLTYVGPEGIAVSYRRGSLDAMSAELRAEMEEAGVE